MPMHHNMELIATKIFRLRQRRLEISTFFHYPYGMVSVM